MNDGEFLEFIREAGEYIKTSEWKIDWLKRGFHLTIEQELELVDIMNVTPEGMKQFIKLTSRGSCFHTFLEDVVEKEVEYDANEGFQMFDKPRMVKDTIRVCPECKDHVYGSIGVYHDCKNEFVTTIQKPDGTYGIVTVAQCECSGPDHGRRK